MILLIKPETVDNGFSLDMALKTEPLELEYIRAMLKDCGIDSFIYEASFDGRRFEAVLKEYRPDAVAITGYITQEYIMLSYARRAKKYNPKILTMIGGSHAQLNASHFYRPEVDYICRSDNIFAIKDVLKYEGILKSEGIIKGEDFSPEKSRPVLKDIDGLCYRKDGVWHENPIQPFDINLLPFPDRSSFTDHMEHYRYLDASPIALIKTSTSCPFHCSFCYGRALNCGKYSQRDMGKIIDEIEAISCDTIQIADDDFLFDPGRLRSFIDLIRTRKIQKTFICYGRADFIASHEELLEDLYSIGVRYLMVGLEAVTNHYLDSYGKKTSRSCNLETIRLLKKYHIHLVGLFIIDIHFRKEDFRAMRRFIHEQGITYTGVSIFTPIPGTALYQEYEDRLTTHNMEKWDFMHLVVPPTRMRRFHFYLEYYLLVMDLFQVAQKAGIYSFLRLKDYKRIFLKLLLTDGFRRRS